MTLMSSKTKHLFMAGAWDMPKRKVLKDCELLNYEY